ncbi:MAG: hypothetical protein HKN43_00740 [Rhodothermales bacterium]|nr:hypothetical protein [Rhodothermales bacterium]
MNSPLFSDISKVYYPVNGETVEATAAVDLAAQYGLEATASDAPREDGINVSLSRGSWKADVSGSGATPWMYLRVSDSGAGHISASESSLLYAATNLLNGGLTDDQVASLSDGVLLESSFSMHRPLFDYTLTQVGRAIRDFDPEQHIAAMARSGFTHVEVNALQAHVPLEPGVPHEYYAQFYTYCAGLNHFVDSDISRGFYPLEYLTANLNKLKHLASLSRKYGMTPGILCFEPRSMPEAFFKRYPTLRGGRIDHPFRSHLPRYTLAQSHPVAQDHYRQMIRNLMQHVPDLAYMSVWTNDSGAGFEHTSSLYVGRNGGPYLIREWRDHDAIAKSAGESALGWLRNIRDEARKINPEFEVSLRLEPFKEEHDILIEGMGDGLTVEVPSLLVRGYELPYSHPRYPEETSVGGSIFHDSMDDQETAIMAEYQSRGFEPKMTYSCGGAFNTEPLLGIPFPRMLYRKLSAFRQMGTLHASAFGGIHHTEKTPYWPNIEVMRLAQLNRDLDIDQMLSIMARNWVGDESAQTLIDCWDKVEESVAYLPLIPLFSHFGFVWLRTWVRPLLANLEAVPRAERAYFERYMVTTPNNPSINDLGQDVLFQLITEESGRQMTQHFDEYVFPRIDAAVAAIEDAIEKASDDSKAVFVDLRDRTRALKCWATTQRNTTAWVANVYGYLRTDDPEEKARFNDGVQAMIDLDLANTRELHDLLSTTESEVVMLSEVGETSFIYGENLIELLERKIALTEKYRSAEPYIDREIMWRIDFC